MRWLVTTAAIILAALLSPTTASAITFGEWASSHGYLPGAVMPVEVRATSSSIDSLDGIGDFEWVSTPTTTLSLYNNQIASIEEGDFSGLTNLAVLSLSYNWLTSIEPGTFSGLTNLTSLDLVGNQLTSIEPGTFSGLTNLRSLGLRQNRLSSIEAGDFSGLTNLTRLVLMQNQLTSIEVGAFSDLTNLTSLILHYNRLTSIDTGTFSGLTNLTYLNLEHNQLSSIEAGAFSGLTNLPSLFLRHNRLSSIEAGDFSGLTNLTSLDLLDNQIASIEADDFSSLTNLTELYLYHNRLASIEAGAFSGMASLSKLTLGDNPALTELNLEGADFSNLIYFDVAGNVNLTRVSLKNSVLNQDSFVALMDGGWDEDFDKYYIGIGWVSGIAHTTELNLSGIDFINITDLAPLYLMDDLTDLWLADTRNLDALALDVLLDELGTIEGTEVEGVLHMTQADFSVLNAAGGGLLAMWHAEDGHHVAFVPEPATVLLLLAALALAGLRGSRVTSSSLPSRTGKTNQKQRRFKRWLAFGAALTILALLSPMAASGYTFADWAYYGLGYRPGDVMPSTVDASEGGFDSLSGIGLFDWTSTPTLRLDLDHNLIFSVETDAFSGLTNLTNLDLSYNEISRIETGAFNGLTNLADLDLRYNWLWSIEAGDFSGLTDLSTLNLGRNRLSSIEAGGFSGLTNLTDLNLFDNQLRSIEASGFSGLTNLTTLQLYNNILTSIDVDDFSSLTTLESLGLGLNWLTSIEAGVFSGLPNLTSLDLRQNRLRSLEAGAFSGLTNLTDLDLFDNQLTSIESGVFSGLSNLTTLDLRSNSALTRLNLTDADFSSLNLFALSCCGNITSVSLRGATLSQTSVARIMDGGTDSWSYPYIGIGELGGITELDLSGIDFANITDLAPLYVMDELTDLWIVGTLNLDAIDLDILLDNLATIEGTDVEGVLHMTQADFNAFNTAGGGRLADWHAEDGHHVAFVVPEPATCALLMLAMTALLCRHRVVVSWPMCLP